MSASGLARRAGLDPTTFNKSKRIMPNGRQRWPSTESVSKVLKATGASLDEFMALLQGADGDMAVRRIPLIGHAQAGEAGYFDDAGYPTGAGWDEVDFPDQGGRFAYALEISGESMAPVYRDGDRIVVSPDASVRRGDRVVVRTAAGEVMAKEVQRMTGEPGRAAVDQPRARRPQPGPRRHRVHPPDRLGQPVAAEYPEEISVALPAGRSSAPA